MNHSQNLSDEMESDDVKVIGDESASGDKKVNDDSVSFWDKWIWIYGFNPERRRIRRHLGI